jgi:Uma2 family endonuclease
MSVVNTATSDQVLVADPVLAQQLIAERALAGSDRLDEVWEGVYVMNPIANVEHQELIYKITMAIGEAIGRESGTDVFPGLNVSDRVDGWEHNYRCPDVAVYLAGNPAIRCEAHYCGGPDLAFEIGSRGDRSRLKIPFYGQIGTRELFIVDRAPWALEQFSLEGGQLLSRGRSTCEEPEMLASAVLPLKFRLVGGTPRPRIEVASTSDSRRWLA